MEIYKMKIIQDKITKIINEKNKNNDLVYIYEFTRLYKQLNLYSLIELKHINMKKQKIEYEKGFSHKEVRNYNNNILALKYIIYKKLGGELNFGCWIQSGEELISACKK